MTIEEAIEEAIEELDRSEGKYGRKGRDLAAIRDTLMQRLEAMQQVGAVLVQALESDEPLSTEDLRGVSIRRIEEEIGDYNELLAECHHLRRTLHQAGRVVS